MQTAGKGVCGASQWSAARETARRASKLDEEGLEVAVCRHGVLLKALNMYRGEIFAYPLYLQKEPQAATKSQFYCTDIACKYWPYLEKVAVSMLDLRPLLQMKPSFPLCMPRPIQPSVRYYIFFIITFEIVHWFFFLKIFHNVVAR